MLDDALLARKTALRTAMRQRLAGLSLAERTERSHVVVSRIMESPTWAEAARVLLFAPLPIEPDIDGLWPLGALTGKQVAYPRVEGTSLTLYYVLEPDELEQTRWGLREPPTRAAREALLDDFDLVLVPGLAFDETSVRLGRGGGFYDRLLSRRDASKTRLVGVGFGFQRVAEPLPAGLHDVRMDAVCTD